MKLNDIKVHRVPLPVLVRLLCAECRDRLTEVITSCDGKDKSSLNDFKCCNECGEKVVYEETK